MIEKFMTTLSKEAREQLKIISAKERKAMNTILEEMILGYNIPLEYKDYLFLVDGIDMPQVTGCLEKHGENAYIEMAKDIIEKCVYMNKDKATIVSHVNNERIYIGSVYKEETNDFIVWIADIKNCPRIQFDYPIEVYKDWINRIKEYQESN